MDFYPGKCYERIVESLSPRTPRSSSKMRRVFELKSVKGWKTFGLLREEKQKSDILNTENQFYDRFILVIR